MRLGRGLSEREARAYARIRGEGVWAEHVCWGYNWHLYRVSRMTGDALLLAANLPKQMCVLPLRHMRVGAVRVRALLQGWGEGYGASTDPRLSGCKFWPFFVYQVVTQKMPGAPWKPWPSISCTTQGLSFPICEMKGLPSPRVASKMKGHAGMKGVQEIDKCEMVPFALAWRGL